jgi:hypothetical protein
MQKSPTVLQPRGVPIPPTPPTRPAPPSGATSVTAAPSAPAPVVFTLDMLRARGRELSNQLNSAQGRRDGLARELRRADDAAKVGMQARMDVLDKRLSQLESDIATNGQLIVQAAGDNAAMDQTTTQTLVSTPFGLMPPGNVTAISVVFTIFVLFPISVAAARLLWKRGNRPVASNAQRESDLRMERVEQAVDTIAVEIERISEGQRFVTQLMSKQQASALPAAQAEPLRVPLNETVMNVGARKNVVG